MKNRYTLIFFTLITSFLTAQKVDFTIEEGYVQGLLDSNPNWGGSNWFVYPTSGTERAETTAAYSWARWGVPFTVSDTEITFEVHFRFNIDLPAVKLISRFGFNDNGSNSGNIANIQLSTLNDGSLYIRKQGNTPVDSGSAGLTDFQQDDLVINMVLTLGADAASSSMSSTITNVTDKINSGVAVVNGIPAAVFNAATSGGISGFIHAQDNINGTRGFLVDKVVMTQGDTFTNNSGDNQWNTPLNWTSGSVPSSYTDVSITTGQTIEAGNATAAVANTIVVNSGGSLTIDQTSSLTVSDDFTNNGTFTLNSGGSLIVNGTSSGNVTYNRNLGTTNWYLMS